LGSAPLPSVPLTPPGPFKTTLRRSSRPAPRAAVALSRGTHPGALPLTLHALLVRAALRQVFLSLDPRSPRAPQVSPSGPVILYASVKPGGTGSDTEAGVRRSNSLFATLLTTQVRWGSTPAPSPCAPSLAVRPLAAGPWARVSLSTRMAPPHRGRDIPGRHDPVTGLRLLCTLDPAHPVTRHTFGRHPRMS